MTHPENNSHALGVLVTGFRASITELCDALARQPGIAFLGAARSVAEAERTFGAGKVDVVVHATDGAFPRSELAAIRDRTPAPVVLLVESPDAGFFEDALHADVADVVLLPELAERVAFTVRKAALARVRGAGGQVRAHVITVFSPKGGTGKTVVASNLAASFAKHEGLRTLLVDLDLQFGDAAIMLGVKPAKTLHDLVTAAGELDAGKFRGYLTRHSASGADVLAAPLRPEGGERVTEENIERVLDVAQAGYEVIVVDTSPFFHGPMLSTLDHTDDLLVVCSPEVPALKNVRLGVETLRLLSFPEERMRLCLNRSGTNCGVGRHEVEGALHISVDYELPNDEEVPTAVNLGTPLVLSSPSSEFSSAVQTMGRSLLRFDGAASPPDGQYGDRSHRGGLIRTVRDLAGDLLPSRDKDTADTAGRPT
jgi:pilus assembly protein CpaE